MSGFWTEECHGSWELLEAEETQPMRCVTLPEVLKEKSFLVVAKLLHTSECLWIPLNIMNNLWQVSKRGLAVTAARRADQVMPDPVEHATGKTFGWQANEWVRSFSLRIENENAATETFFFSKLFDGLKFCLLRSWEVRAAGQVGWKRGSLLPQGCHQGKGVDGQHLGLHD